MTACSSSAVTQLALDDLAVTTAEDTAVTFDLPVTANDAAAVTLTIVTQPAHGTVTGAGPSWTYTPTADFNGSDSVVVRGEDRFGSATATVAITVTPVNDAPIAHADSFADGFDVRLHIPLTAVLANDGDVDGTSPTVTAVTAITHGVPVLGDDEILFTPEAGFEGTASFEYTISDGTQTSHATVTITIGPDTAPTATDDVVTTDEDTAAEIDDSTLLANDSDPDNQTLRISTVGNPSHGTVTHTGRHITFVPDADYHGAAGFDYAVTDGFMTDTASVAITVVSVNDAPVGVADVASTNEDTAVTMTSAELVANDTDRDSDPLTVSAVAATALSHGSVTLANGIVTYTPDADFNGTAEFSYTVDDGNGGTGTATVTVTVAPVNDPPIAVADLQVTSEDTPLVVAGGVLTANDTDVDGDALTVTAVTPTATTHGSVTLVAGTITYTPAANYNGPADFGYTISDGNGGAASATVSVTVTAVNDPPVTVADALSTDEDTALVVAATVLTANDVDVDGDVPTVTAVTPTATTHGSVVLFGGTVTYTPTANYNGPADFGYTISDGNGGTATGTVEVTVISVNDPPVAVADALTTDEDTPLTFAASVLTANDTDIEADVLTVTAVSATATTHGTVSLSSGTITYAPAANYNGAADFQYTIVDVHGGTASGTVSITVTPVNDAPVTAADAMSTDEDTPLVFAAATLAANDSDVDGDALTVTAVAATATTHGTVSLSSGTVTYTPAANYNGPADFSYTVSDGHSGSATGSVAVTVLAVNDAPVITASSGTLSYTENAVAAAIDVGLTITDADDATLVGATVQIVTGCTNPEDVLARAAPPLGITVTGYVAATCTLTLTGVASVASYQTALRGVTYANTSDAPASTARTVRFTIDDGEAANHTASADRDLSVTAVDDAPVAVNDSATVAEDSGATAIPVLANDTDVDNGLKSIASVTQPAHGTVVITGGGTGLTYAPNANYCTSVPSFIPATDTFTYTLTPGSSTATVSVRVTCVDDPPVAVDDVATVAQGSSANALNVLANDTDVDGGAKTIASISQPAHGAATIGVNGLSINYTPAPGYCNQIPNAALDTFTYTLTPGGSSATVSVTVTCACGTNKPTDFVVGSN